MEIKILDKGFVRFIEMLGDDMSAVQAARVSYGKGLTNIKRDRKLLFYLIEHDHHTPFEHIVFKFHVKTPIFVMRQWIRHRISSVNERSGRYTEFNEEWYIPEKIRTDDNINLQGSNFSSDEKLNSDGVKKIEESIERSFEEYRKLREMGVAKELARIVLPVSMYTEFYWTLNVRSLMNFLNLRADGHAQFEIREYAKAIAKIFEEKCPNTYEAFLKFYYKGNILKGAE